MVPNASEHIYQHPINHQPTHFPPNQRAWKLPQETRNHGHLSLPRTLSSTSTIHLSRSIRDRLPLRHTHKHHRCRSDPTPCKARLRNRSRTSGLASEKTNGLDQPWHSRQNSYRRCSRTSQRLTTGASPSPRPSSLMEAQIQRTLGRPDLLNIEQRTSFRQCAYQILACPRPLCNPPKRTHRMLRQPQRRQLLPRSHRHRHTPGCAAAVV